MNRPCPDVPAWAGMPAAARGAATVPAAPRPVPKLVLALALAVPAGLLGCGPGGPANPLEQYLWLRL